MNIKGINREKNWICTSTFIITFALSTDSFINIIYKNRYIQILTIILSMSMLLVVALNHFDYKINIKILPIKVMWIVTSFFVLYNNVDLEKSIGASYAIYYIIAIILLLILSQYTSWIEYFAKFMLVTSMVYAIFTILFRVFKSLYYIVIPKIYSGAILTQLMQQYDENHMAGIASHYSTNTIYIVYGIGIMICFYFSNKYENKRYFKRNILILFTLLIAVFFTGKRGTIIFGFLAILMVFLSQVSIRKFRKFVRLGIVLTILIVLGTIIIYIIPEIRESIFSFLRLEEGKTLNDITSGRIELYTRALNDFKDNPLFGNGWGYYKHKYAYLYSYVGTGFYMDVHNIYIQLLAETGMVGFLAFLSPILFTLRSTYKLLKKSSIKMITLSKQSKRDLKLSLFLQSFFILYGFTGNTLYDYWVFIIYILGVSMFLAVYGSIRKNKIYNKL